MARSNIRQQFLRAILGCCKFGESKHAYKRGTENGGQGYMPESPYIFSDNYKESLKEFAFMAAKFINSNFPEIKLLKNIKVRYWNALMETKVGKCSTKTLNLYRSHIHKLELCVEHHYLLKYSLNWTKGLVVPDSMKTPLGELLRVQQMSRKDFESIMEYAQRDGTWSRAPVSWMLSSIIGLRVAEAADICVKNVFISEEGKWGLGYVEVWGKGKRHRKIDISTQEARAYLIKVTDGRDPDEKIVGIKADSINHALRAAAIDLNLKKKYPYTGTHSIRKLYSQELFRFVQSEKKMKEYEAMRYVNAQLGHSEERDEELLAIYVMDVKRKREREKKKRQNMNNA